MGLFSWFKGRGERNAAPNSVKQAAPEREEQAAGTEEEEAVESEPWISYLPPKEERERRKRAIVMTPEEARWAGAMAFREGNISEGLPLLEYAAENGNPEAAYTMAWYWDQVAQEASQEGDTEGFQSHTRTADDYYLISALGGGTDSRRYLNNRARKGDEYAAELLRKHPELAQDPPDPKAPLKLDVRAEALAAAKAAYEKEDYAEAIKQYTLAAEHNSGEAMLRLGEMYERGTGTAEDPDKAFLWYRKASNAASVQEGGENCLRICWEQYQRYTGRQEDKALLWLTRAVDLGNDDARYLCGTRYENGVGTPVDQARALWFYQTAADRGYVEAQFKCGLFYSRGLGTEKDPARGLAWLLLAAREGHAEAQYNCGVMYRNGIGTPKDPGRALYWFEKAAGRSYPPAEEDLYLLLQEHPEFLEERPLSWLEEAGEAGDTEAQIRCGITWYEKSEPGHMAKAIHWFELAAEQGVVLAQYNCGVAYNQSSESTYNTTKALHWFKEAAEQGHPKAMINCGVLYYGDFELTGDEHDRSESRYWFRKAAEQTEDEDTRKGAQEILDTKEYWDPLYHPLDS